MQAPAGDNPSEENTILTNALLGVKRHLNKATFEQQERKWKRIREEAHKLRQEHLANMWTPDKLKVLIDEPYDEMTDDGKQRAVHNLAVGFEKFHDALTEAYDLDNYTNTAEILWFCHRIAFDSAPSVMSYRDWQIKAGNMIQLLEQLVNLIDANIVNNDNCDD